MKIILSERQYMKLLVEQDSTIKTDCSTELKNKLNNRYTILYFKDAINRILNPYKKSWKEYNDYEKYKKILELIGKTESEIDSTLDVSFVYDEEGKWDRINKLNTNYSDLSNLITDIFKNQNQDLCKITERLEEGDKSDLVELSKDMMENPTSYYETYFMTDKEKYVVNNTINSEVGNRIEQNVIDYLIKENGWTLIYQSTEGSPIDTKLAIDIIMMDKENNIYKIQVKTVGSIKEVDVTPCEEKGLKFSDKKIPGGYFVFSKTGTSIRAKDINLVVYATRNNKFLLVKRYSPVTIQGNDCLDIPSYEFPSNPRGSFYVDHESVISTNV